MNCALCARCAVCALCCVRCVRCVLWNLDHRLPNEHLANFCFPNDVPIESIKKKELDGFIMRPLEMDTIVSNRSYFFLVTTEDSLLYGVCVRLTEQVNDV